MRTAKYLSLAALLLILPLLTVRLPWTQQRLLSWAGLHQVSVDLAAFNGGQLHLRSLSATLDRPTGPVDIKLTDTVLTYRPWRLLQGQLDGITAATVAITLPATVPMTPKESAAALPDLTGMLRRIYKNKRGLPVRQLHVEQLRLGRGAGDSLKNQALTVDLTTTEEEGQASIRPANAGPDKASSSIATIRVMNGQVTGSLQFDLADLQRLMPQTGSVPLRGKIRAELNAETDQPAHLHLTISALQHPRLTAEEIRVQLDISRLFADQPLILASTSHLSVKNCKGPGFAAAAIETNLTGQLDIQPNSWRLQLQSPTPWTGNGLIAGDIRLAPFQLNDLTADLRINHEQLQGTCTFAAPYGSGTFTAGFSSQRSGDQGGQATLRSTGPLVMSENSNLLRLLADPALPAALNQGIINFSSQVIWGRKTPPAMQATIDLTGGQGLLFGSPFAGLTVQQHLQILPRLQSMRPGLIQLSQLQGPVPVANLLIKTSLGPSAHGSHPKLLIEQASAELFDGKVHLENCTYDSNNPPSDCLLQIEELDLPRILALHKMEGLTASGRVGGSLPLHFTPEGVSVNQGRLENGPEGGLIKYQPAGEGLQASPLTDYALKALEEFHYQKLVAQIQYIPNGTLTVNLQLQGKSPKLESTRPIHLNLNTEQNLLSLLKSLQYSQKLTSELDQQIQQRPHLPHPN